jgi:hypothetical protein
MPQTTQIMKDRLLVQHNLIAEQNRPASAVTFRIVWSICEVRAEPTPELGPALQHVSLSCKNELIL